MLISINMMLKFNFLLLIPLFASVVCEMNGEVNVTSELERNNEYKLLSRKKRFIIFPEGSSFQLVFCVTYPALAQIGDILLWGNTAALAFELPQDPYSPFNHRADPLHRRVDTKTIYFTDYDGKIIDKRPYKRKTIVNPAFAKRSVDASESRDIEYKMDRKRMHASRHKREYLKGEQLEAHAIEFHRNGRAALYQKIETMLQGLGADGRQCVLKSLCMVAQSQNHPQGEFLQEILRAVLTLPESSHVEEHMKEYDAASKAKESCDQLYPDCNDALSDVDSPTFSY